LKELLKDGTSKENKVLNDYFYGREVIDVLLEHPSIKLAQSINDFLGTLGQLLPRYYSISSAYIQDPSKVSITIAIVRYQSHNRDRKGVCSTFLSDRTSQGDIIPIFVNDNPDFRMPKDSSLPILMIGPGTGIAPFRAMLQERIITNATGKNILYFGCRLTTQDFLYKEELERLRDENKLVLHTAFSREQKKKVYVQHKLIEASAEVWDLIQSGGHIYVCGDAKYMAVDVHAALIDISMKYGNQGKEEAEKLLANLESVKRYQKDVWF